MSQENLGELVVENRQIFHDEGAGEEFLSLLAVEEFDKDFELSFPGEELDLNLWLEVFFLIQGARREQSLHAPLHCRNLHFIFVVSLDVKFEDIWRFVLLLQAPQEEIHVAVIKLAIDGVGIGHHVDGQLSFVYDFVTLIAIVV